MNIPIRVRLTAWYAALLGATLLAFSTYLVLQVRTDLRNGVDREIAAATSELHAELRADASAHELSGHELRTDARPILPGPGAAQILDERGRVLDHFGGPGRTPMISTVMRERALDGPHATVTLALGKEEQRYRVRAAAFRAQGQQRILVTAVSLQPVERSVARIIFFLVIAGPLVLVATVLAGYWLARKALRPVDRMAADAQAIDMDRLGERVAVPPSADEMRRLARTLNAMLDRIESGVKEKRRLLGDASHELRTPLAVMRAELDVSLRVDNLSTPEREVLASVREEVDRMSRIVDNLLTLAQADEGRLELIPSRMELQSVAEAVSDSLAALAAAKNVRIVVDGEYVQARADVSRLQLALTNLVENAVKFSPTGGAVRVTVWKSATELGVTVADEGPGVAEADRVHLFDRFYRTDTSRARETGGSGLGLAICREVIEAHGGRVWVESEPGRGSSFFLALPVSCAIPHGQSPELSSV